MKSFFQVLFLSFFFFIFAGCGAAEENTPQSDENITTTEDNNKTILTLPEDWEIFPKNIYQKNIIFSAQEPFQGENISTIVSVAQENFSPQSLQRFADISLENIRQASQDFQKISEEKIFLSSGKEAILVNFLERNSVDLSSIGFYTLFSIDTENMKSTVITISYDPLTPDHHKKFLQDILKSYTW